ncbi:MAG: TolB family protein [Calditrichia bacterium]
MKRYLVILFVCFLISCSYAQSKILFSRSSGGLNTGKTPSLMTYDPATKEVRTFLKGQVAKRGEYAAVVSPDKSKLLSNTYVFGGWKLGIATINNGTVGSFERFTSRPNYEYNAKWSYDGKKVAYQEFNWSERDTDIFIANSDGRNVKRLTNVPGGDRTPQWTRDDKQIVFTSGREDSYEIYIQSVNSEAALNLSKHASTDFAPSTCAVNDKIAFLSDRDGAVHLYTMSYNGSGLKNMTPLLKSGVPGDGSFEGNGYWAYQTSWSPDGKQIVFNVLIGSDLELFMVDADGKNLVQLTDNADSDFCPTWIK